MNTELLKKGPLAWMAGNPVAANLLMIAVLMGGFYMATSVRQEVMPEFELNIVTVTVPYPGASPSEVEQGILLAVEENIRGLDQIKEVTSSASEGMASVRVELNESANGNKSLQDIKNAVDRITSFPQEAERPIVQLVTNRREVISLVLYGDMSEHELRGLAEDVRERLLTFSEITEVAMLGIRPMEIGIEIPEETLRAHNLTLDKVASDVRNTALELPAGGVKTPSGEVLLRTAERRNYASEYANIPIVRQADGTILHLGEIAKIKDDFRDTETASYFNGKRAVRLSISRVGEQRPMEIAQLTKDLAEELKTTLPPGVGVATWVDASEMFADRIDLLTRNAAQGLVLVLITLGLFLEIRLAFWVMMGIPISMLGSFLLFPQLDVSVNMISLFAFIITLGIVVDDAIVVGENIYENREKGMDRVEAAIAGVRAVATPVCFSVVTNMISFVPLLFVPGVSGKFFRVIPITVISVFAFSLFESLFLLPAHLAHQKPSPNTGYRASLRRGQRRVGALLETFIEKIYQPFLKASIHHRYLTLSIAIAIMMISVGVVKSGMVAFTYMPKIDTDLVTANAALTFGAPVADTEKVSERLVKTAQEIIAENGGDAVLRGILTEQGANVSNGNGPSSGTTNSGGHLTSVSVYLVPSGSRDFTASDFAKQWRKKVADLAGLETLTFQYSTGPAAGAAINVQLSHRDLPTLENAAAELAGQLSDYSGIKDVSDGFELGKPQYDFKLRPEASAQGLKVSDLAGQLRSAFYGARAFRQQRGREEIWVMVRLPEKERRSTWDVANMMVRTPSGGEIPVAEAADLEMGHAYTKIKRVNGRRVVNVTADINMGEANANEVLEDLSSSAIPTLLAKHPGLSFSLEGDSRNQKETMASLKVGFAIAMCGVFFILAIPFRSYTQPLVIMTAIPFGVVGAIAGHMVMGYDLSIISMMGIVALSGVVINDSLVFIHAVNEYRIQVPFAEALVLAGKRRFRPIMLTSLTTFMGLAPMMTETSVQARFLIPMAISLGFGILASTLIVLLVIPSLCTILEDIRGIFSSEPPEHPETPIGEEIEII